MTVTTELISTKIFADGANIDGMLELYRNPLISGFTTNPTLMKKAGVKDYKAFSLEVLSVIKDRPISFEIISDELQEMERQALEIASWGQNVYVKVPITNTKGVSTAGIIKTLSNQGVKLNVTAVMTLEQVKQVTPSLKHSPGAYISVFAGRIADSGRDPIPTMQAVLEYLRPNHNLELIWASPREILNLVQANNIGCHIITMTHDLLQKIPSLGKDLLQFSLDTVKMFYKDAQEAGLSLPSNTDTSSEEVQVRT